MDYRNSVVVWTPIWLKHGKRHGEIKVYRHGDRADKDYRFSCGGCHLPMKKWDDQKTALQMMLDFHTIVVRDGVDPIKAHEAFSVFDLYQHYVSPELTKEGQLKCYTI